MSVKVELGFTASGAGGPFFFLDDSVRGVLDNTNFLLAGGEALVDVTRFARRISIDRGKSRELDRYQAGRASVEFNNNGREFDPTYTDSPFFGQIVPRRTLRITLDGQIAYEGIVDDWNLNFDASGVSVAACNAFDTFSALAGIVITEPDGIYDDFPEQTTGERIADVLEFISWNQPTNIDTGSSVLYDALVPFNTNALAYLQLVADSEPGELFVGKTGEVTFKERNNLGGVELTLADDGSGISFAGVQVVFGSEQLYNQIQASNEDDTITVEDHASIDAFGERDLQITSLIADLDELRNYADYLLLQYKNPEFRFESMTVNLLSKTPEERAALSALEIGDPVTVRFTPSSIGDPIVRLSKCIGIGHQRVPGNEVMTIKLQTYAFAPLLLDDALFGRLDDISVLGW